MMMRLLVLLLACVLASGEKAQPPQILGGFPKVTYFFDKSDVKTLECKATGIPDARYEWKKDDKIIRDGEHDFKIDGGKLTLTGPLEGTDDGYYQCFAENSYGKAMSSKAQMLHADLGSFAKVSIADQAFDVGQHGLLACRSKPFSEPAATVSWYLDESKTVETNERVVVDQAGNLHFINVLASDEVSTSPVGKESFYNCSLYNALTRKRVYGSPTKLTVNPGSPTPRNPNINFRTPDGEAIAYVGQHITLQCIPDGYPLPTVEWSRNGGSLSEGRYVIDNKAYKLTINNVTENDEGNYRCEAVSGGQRNADTIFVDVKSVPIWVNKLRSLTMMEGETAKFQCVARSAQGETDTVDTKWFKNGNPLSPGVTGKILVSGAHLQVQGISKPDDLMNIQCKVSNTVGIEMADAFLNVLERTVLITKPEPKQLIDPGQELRTSIAATADPLYASQMTYNWAHGGKPVTGRKENGDRVYVTADHALVINATGMNEVDDRQAFLDLLGNYTCLVSLGLDDGTGDVETYSYITSEKKDEIVDKPKSDVNLWWIAIIVAVIVLIIIILLICCLLYRNRGRTYPVDEKERWAGHDPEKELADSGFQDLSRADDPDEKKPYGSQDQESLNDNKPIWGDTDSLDEYGEPDRSKFNEDGPFNGNYGVRRGRQEVNQTTV